MSLLVKPLRMARTATGVIRRGLAQRRAIAALRRARGSDTTPGHARDKVILIDGLWNNVNHFLRLHVFLAALPDAGAWKPLALLRKPSDSTAGYLRALGCHDFLAIDRVDASQQARYRAAARAMLAKVETHGDILALSLPHGMPAYVFYDTALKLARHPRPPIGDPVWESALADQLRYLDEADSLFSSRSVDMLVFSHPWKSEFAAFLWLALSRGITCHHLTGFCDSVRIRRLATPADYSLPVEHMSRRDFDALSEAQQQLLVAQGRRDLARRSSAPQSDINARMAYRADLRYPSREAVRADLALDPSKPIVSVASHVWYDFPHTYGMRNFTDFLDFMEFTLATIREIDTVNWVLKPHPTESWYGHFHLSHVARDLPPHVRLLPIEFDAASLLMGVDGVVTVHGTVALEATAAGRWVIAADRSYYGDWGFVHQATSRDHYADLLRQADRLAPPVARQRDLAAACLAAAIGAPPEGQAWLEIQCDSTGLPLYDEAVRILSDPATGLATEVGAIRAWMESGDPSFAAFRRVQGTVGKATPSQATASQPSMRHAL